MNFLKRKRKGRGIVGGKGYGDEGGGVGQKKYFKFYLFLREIIFFER